MNAQRHNKSPSFTKKIILLFILLIPLWSIAQTGKNFFIEAYNKEDLIPIRQTEEGKYIKLEFSDPQLNSIFEELQIMKYENTFEDLDLCRDLGNVFTIEVVSEIDKEYFTRNPLIKTVELIPEYELASGELPNDYYTPNLDLVDPKNPSTYDMVKDTVRNSYLDLIEAPCAWELTHGNPNIMVGVADSKIMENHEDLTGKIEALIGNHGNGHYHATGVAGLIAGNTNNGKGMASIGYNTKMVGVNSWDNYRGVKDLAIWSHNNDNKIRVINMSWGEKIDKEELISEISTRTILKRMYKCISEKYNIVLVAAGHNWSSKDENGDPNPPLYPNDRYSFPAYWESVIAVTSVGHINDYQTYDHTVDQGNANLKNVLWWWGTMDDEGRHYQHNLLYDQIDIAAPGYHIYRPTVDGNSTNSYVGGGATSVAAPLVSGTAALMLSVNPDLTSAEVKSILKHTADRIDTIPHNQEYFGPNKLSNELGRLNAYKAVKMAKYFDEYGYDLEAMPRKVDLMIRDNEEDIGEEPNETTDIFWDSPDIWVRNQPDGIKEHENAEYDPSGPSYVYVRIKNIGCDPTSGEDKVKLYWTKAASSMSWDEDYLGNKYYANTNAKQGDTINTVKIPSINPGEEKILEIPWTNIPDPEDYHLINTSPWHFCLLARIESEDDPITHEETTSVLHNDKYNNNIASKNLTVINLNPGTIGEDLGGGFGFPNPLETTGHFDLHLKPEEEEEGRAIFREAEVRVILDEALKTAWEAGGKQSEQLIQETENVFLVTGENAKLKNIKLEPQEFGVVYIDFHFLTKEITEKETYLYHAIQRKSSNDEIMGGESFQINKSPRPLFYAETPENKKIDKGEEIVLEAESIGEPAVYNWYDNEGNLIYEGIDFSASVEIGKEYKLEVIALADGYKDYAEVQFSYKPNRVISLSPNPTANEVLTEYKINEGETAYLAITSIENPTISDNYILDIEESDITIDVETLPVGVYTIALIVNGEIADSKNLIKQ